MKTKEQILSKFTGQIRAENKDIVFWDDAILAMEEYAKQQVKNRNTPAVIKRAFFAGCESRNEEYETESFEQSWNIYAKKHGL